MIVLQYSIYLSFLVYSIELILLIHYLFDQLDPFHQINLVYAFDLVDRFARLINLIDRMIILDSMDLLEICDQFD